MLDSASAIIASLPQGAGIEHAVIVACAGLDERSCRDRVLVVEHPGTVALRHRSEVVRELEADGLYQLAARLCPTLRRGQLFVLLLGEEGTRLQVSPLFAFQKLLPLLLAKEAEKQSTLTETSCPPRQVCEFQRESASLLLGNETREVLCPAAPPVEAPASLSTPRSERESTSGEARQIVSEREGSDAR